MIYAYIKHLFLQPRIVEYQILKGADLIKRYRRMTEWRDQYGRTLITFFNCLRFSDLWMHFHQENTHTLWYVTLIVFSFNFYINFIIGRIFPAPTTCWQFILTTNDVMNTIRMIQLITGRISYIFAGTWWWNRNFGNQLPIISGHDSIFTSTIMLNINFGHQVLPTSC